MDVRLLWAKTSREQPDLVHPLICHMIDVAQVADAIWKQVFPFQQRTDIAHELGLTEEQARAWFVLWAGLHDLGKACPPFQAQHERSKARLLDMGLAFPHGIENLLSRVKHGTVTACVLADLLADCLKPPLDAKLAQQVALIVGGHHGIFATSGEIDALYSKQLGDQRWQAIRAELVKTFVSALALDGLQPPSVQEIPPALSMALAGFVSVADWLGSRQEYFPPAGYDVDLSSYVQVVREQACRAVRETGWSRLSSNAEPVGFETMFSVPGLRPLQQRTVELTEQLKEGGLVIIEAPMGEGKTEAALYLADYWKRTLDQFGLYVAMPTQATSNQMFTRVREVLRRLYPEERVNFQLLHGNALLSEEFERMRLAAGGDETTEGDVVVAEEWFLPKKRGLLAPFAVGTVDQSFLAVLRTRHAFVRLFGLGHKTVIFDEVHAYDAYMSTLLERLLRWLAAMKTTVVVLSATLPSATRNRLVEAYSNRPIGGQQRAYPAITWVTSSQSGTLPFPATRPVSLDVVWVPGEPCKTAEILREKLSDGGCAAVICNTVGRAQKVYLELKAQNVVPESDLLLFHARFPFAARERLEQLVVGRFGRDRTGRPAKAVVVATQVIEQSLDLDFDVMITDLAPADLVLQRAGRTHRHAAPRPARLQTPCLLIVEPAIQDGTPQFGSDSWIYHPYILLRSLLVLKRYQVIRIPEDVLPIIETVYRGETLEECDLNPPLSRRLEKAFGDWQKEIAHSGHIAKQKLIPSPDQSGMSVLEYTVELQEDNPEYHQSLQALTRLSEPTVTLVCLHGSVAQPALDPDGRLPVDLGKRPDCALARELARRTVNLTAQPLVSHFLGEAPPAGWREHALLRHCRPAIFDRDGICRLANGYVLSLDAELGLIVKKEG